MKESIKEDNQFNKINIKEKIKIKILEKEADKRSQFNKKPYLKNKIKIGKI